ncbi:MAG TPA: hypothetical protein VF723_01760, partial [Pyrinomonadaceae bacterium]
LFYVFLIDSIYFLFRAVFRYASAGLSHSLTITGPAQNIVLLGQACVFGQHPRITFQAHAARVLRARSPDDRPAPSTLDFKVRSLLTRFLVHIPSPTLKWMCCSKRRVSLRENSPFQPSPARCAVQCPAFQPSCSGEFVEHALTQPILKVPDRNRICKINFWAALYNLRAAAAVGSEQNSSFMLPAR